MDRDHECQSADHMDSLIYLQGLGGGQSLFTAPRSHSHSQSLLARAPSPDKSLAKSKSSSAPGSMATVAAAPGLPTRMSSAPVVPLSNGSDPPPGNQWSNGTSTPHHPDLNNEVAALSDKLINAINHQTSLEDNLTATRHELDEARERIHQLESEAQLQRENAASVVMVKKTDRDEDVVRLTSHLTEERSLRSRAEKEKRGMEQELENLTASLFEEANKMVADAKKEQELAERKSEQLRIQLKDNEMLMTSQHEQLTELKLVMQQMGSPEDIETQTNGSATPASPNAQVNDSMSKLFEVLNLTPNTPGAGDITPAPATSFTYLMKPVCRTDLAAYDDFKLLLHSVTKSQPPSRVTSGSYGGLNVMGLGKLGDHSPFNHSTANGSNSSLSTTASASPATPQMNPTNGTPPPREPHVPLKETRFYKRVVSEDVEPTLRLDLAPGVSWLTRRTVLTAICEGGLVVEPMPASTRVYVFSCAMCGENRKGEEYLRTHRFRTSDNEAAQRYPLCISCLDKVRACCDFVGYLRMIKDGHMRVHDADEEKDVWEEIVKLRERLFWCRIGGGVVPAFVSLLDSPQPDESKGGGEPNTPSEAPANVDSKPPSEALASVHSNPPRAAPTSVDSKPLSQASAQNGSGQSENGDPNLESGDAKVKKVRRVSTKGKRTSISAPAPPRDLSGPVASTIERMENGSDDADRQLHNSLRDSVNSKRSSQGNTARPQTPQRKSERLALSIPGSFK